MQSKNKQLMNLEVQNYVFQFNAGQSECGNGGKAAVSSSEIVEK